MVNEAEDRLAGESGDEVAGQPRTMRRWALTLIAVGVLWRLLRYGLDFPIWGDEAFVAVNFVLRGYGQLLEPLEHGQIAPLLFLWAEEAVSRALGFSELALRGLPVLAGVISVPLFWMLARKMVDSTTALAALAIFIASYYPVRHGAEIKPYSTDLLCGIVLLLLWWRVFERRDDGWRWVALTVASALAVWSSFPAVFIAGGGVLAYFMDTLRPRPATEITQPPARGLAFLAVYCAALGASFAVMYAIAGSEQAAAGAFLLDSSHWKFTFPPLEQPWLLPKWFYLVHTGNMFAYPMGGHAPGSAATFLLVIAGTVGLWRRSRRPVVILLLAALPLLFTAAALKKYPYGGSARVSLFFAPAVCLLAGAGVVALLRAIRPPERVWPGVRLVSAIMIVIALAGAARDVVTPYKNLSDREHRRLASRLMRESLPGDTWIIFGQFGESAHAPNLYEWGGSAAILRFNLLRFGRGQQFLWGPEPAALAPGGGTTYLLVYRDNREAFPQPLLDAYLAAVTDRLGSPDQHAEYWMGERDETIEVFRFEGRGR